MTTSHRWKRRPEHSNWGDFGPDDQLGAMNLVGKAQVLKGLAEVRTGQTFSLSLPLDYPGGTALHPRRHPPRRFATLRGGKNEGEQCFCFAMARDNPAYSDVFSDDVVVLHTQYSTQWDGLAHVGSLFDSEGTGTPDVTFYNGYRPSHGLRAAERRAGVADWMTYEDPSADVLGIDNLAKHGVQGRAVMMGKEPDTETLHNSCSGLDGGDKALLSWITDTGIAALISDNFAIELMPRAQRQETSHAMLPLHEHCLFKNGVHLGELWFLRDLATWLRDNGRSRFLLTAPPLHLPGGVASPVTPVATV
jgi:hypothetical protein